MVTANMSKSSSVADVGDTTESERHSTAASSTTSPAEEDVSSLSATAPPSGQSSLLDRPTGLETPTVQTPYEQEMVKTEVQVDGEEKDPAKLLAEAKSAMLSEDYTSASSLYASALEIMNCNGADCFRPHLAPIYYAYGVCLLNHTIRQGQILGENVPATEPEPGSAEDATKVLHFDGDASDEEESNLEEKETTEMIVGGGIDVDLHQDAHKPTAVELESQKSLKKTIEIYDDLQLAWEVLDMARVIYSKQKTSDRSSSLRMAEVCIALGDVGLESETFDVAYHDYKVALEIKQLWLESDDRSIAELYPFAACSR